MQVPSSPLSSVIRLYSPSSLTCINQYSLPTHPPTAPTNPAWSTRVWSNPGLPVALFSAEDIEKRCVSPTATDTQHNECTHTHIQPYLQLAQD